MASTLASSRVSLTISGGMVEAPSIGTGSYSIAESWSNSLTDGSVANKANKIYVLHAAATTTVDLDSTLVLADGSSGAFSRIVAIGIRAATTNAANLLLQGDFILTKFLIPGADTLSAVAIGIRPGGLFLSTAPDATGIAITATTGDGLTITVTGTDVFDLVIFGS
jgi:hypothetical protein